MHEVILIVGMFLVTFSVRYILWGTAGRFSFPGWASDALGFVPAAVLTAIIVPAVLMPDGKQLALHSSNPYMIAAMVAVAFSLWRNNLMLTIVTGMSVFMLLRWYVL